MLPVSQLKEEGKTELQVEETTSGVKQVLLGKRKERDATGMEETSTWKHVLPQKKSGETKSY